MSLETWKQEFYPITAQEAAKLSMLGAIEHSLRKWTGLTVENLRYHEMRYAGSSIVDIPGVEFPITDETCSLCQKYVSPVTAPLAPCAKCPLYLSRGMVPCVLRNDDEISNPYYAFIYHRSPMPMIKALTLAKEWATQNTNES